MDPTRTDKGNPCPRNIRNLLLGLTSIFSAVLTQALAHAQTMASTDRISIDYGYVTQYFQTTWSDPRLPAGVARGMPPSTMDHVSDSDGESSMPADPTNDTTSTGTSDDTSEMAVLYAIDLLEDGMTMVVSVKTSLQPRDCVAIERSGTFLNLRGVNDGFCDSTNQATIASLESVNAAAAQRCKVARAQLEAEIVEENQTLTPSEIGMLCDGS